MMFLYDDSDELVGFELDGEFYYYEKNAIGDITKIKSSYGTNRVYYYTYNAYGFCSDHRLTHSDDRRLLDLNPFKYKSYYNDPESCSYYLQSRYYDYSICRFLNLDDPTIAQQCKDDKDGTNLYAYCCGDPVNYEDPTGKEMLTATAGTIVAAAMVALVAYIVASATLTALVNNIPSEVLGGIYNGVKAKVERLISTFSYVKEGITDVINDIKNRANKNKKSNNTQIHHIVPRNVKITLIKANKKLDIPGVWIYVKEYYEKAGLDIESKHNKIKLKTPFHAALNTNLYYSFVFYMTLEAYSVKSNVKKIKKTCVLITVLFIKFILKVMNMKCKV